MNGRVAVFHAGRQHAYETAAAFAEANSLAWFATSLYYDPEHVLGRAVDRFESVLPSSVVQSLRMRRHPLLQASHVRVIGAEEIVERIAAQAGLRAIEHLANERGNRRFGRRVAQMAIADEVDCLWGFDTASEDAFNRAKPAGIRCVLEQSVAYPRTWAAMIADPRNRADVAQDPSAQPYPEEDLARADRELALADAVVCGSDFVRDSIAASGIERTKLHVIPYGADDRLCAVPRPPRSSPFRLLFVGHFSFRKGAFDLLAALRQVADVQLIVVGHSSLPSSAIAGLEDRVHILGKRSSDEMFDVYQNADAFVLPSLFEGSAIVVYEALMAGLPVIVTPNAGSVIRDGVEGFVVPPRTPDVLAARIRTLAAPGDHWSRMSASARARGVEYPWSRYRSGIRALADQLIGCTT